MILGGIGEMNGGWGSGGTVWPRWVGKGHMKSHKPNIIAISPFSSINKMVWLFNLI